MATTPHSTDAENAPPLLDEADIGSGEKNPAQKETDEMIRQIPPLPPAKDGKAQSGAKP